MLLTVTWLRAKTAAATTIIAELMTHPASMALRVSTFS